jgi:hypothetical protein
MKFVQGSLLCILFALLFEGNALAHKPSDSYLKIFGGGEKLEIQWEVGLKDLDFLIGLDMNQDGEITWGEVKVQRQAIAAHALSRLHIVVDGRECELQLGELMVTRHSDGTYAVLSLTSDCAGDASVLEIEYCLLFDMDPTHRGLVLYTNQQFSSTHILGPTSPNLELRVGEHSVWASLVDYVREGVWHIWIGFDHILFLLSLLLPSVLVLRGETWEPVEAFRPACQAVLKIITVFTLAHSITLWLAVMEYVTLPSRMVEATIAFSIVVTAVNNLHPVLPLKGWAIAFAFGLVHGFGFANVLIDLGLSDTALAVSLFGFNVGVELGQMAIVLVFIPIAYLMRRTSLYQGLILRGGSVLIAIVAAIWMYERVFNTAIIGF